MPVSLVPGEVTSIDSEPLYGQMMAITHRRLGALAALGSLVCLAGCSLPSSAMPSRTAAKASPSGAIGPTATPGASRLIAVLAGGTWNDGPARHDELRIIGVDGRVTASARFQPRTLPAVGAVPVLQDEARVAAGRVYYADGAGVIRTLSPDGSVAEVARLPWTGSQQELSFAVSPDGGELEAAILTLPPPASKPRQSITDPVWDAGNVSIDLYQVLRGQQPTRILHQEWAPDTSKPWPSYQAVGYDQGAIYTMPTELGTQQPYNGFRWFGPAVHFSAFDGSPSAPLAGTACEPQADNGAGVFVCLDQHDRNPSLRKADGSLVWAFPNADENYSYFTFSPLGGRLAYYRFAQATPARGEVITLQGKVVAGLPANFLPRAWLDENTVVGEDAPFQGTRRLAYVALSDPSVMHDLGEPPAFAVIGALSS